MTFVYLLLSFEFQYFSTCNPTHLFLKGCVIRRTLKLSILTEEYEFLEDTGLHGFSCYLSLCYDTSAICHAL